jgi:ribosomal protein S18 acetylase RimI-like enzyme
MSKREYDISGNPVDLHTPSVNNISACIEPLSPLHFKTILSISDLQFGKEFVDNKMLQAYIDDENKYGFVAKIDQEIAGFILLAKYGSEVFKSTLLHEQDWFASRYAKSTNVGVIQTIAIDASFANQGLGTFLTQKGIEILSQYVYEIISICWDQHEQTSYSKVLEKCRFQFVKAIPNYWFNDSLQKNYHCKLCGAPPCKCQALIYEMDASNY